MKIIKQFFNKRNKISNTEIEWLNSIIIEIPIRKLSDEENSHLKKIVKRYKNNPFVNQIFAMNLFLNENERDEAVEYFNKCVDLSIPDYGFSLLYGANSCFLSTGIVNSKAFEFLKLLIIHHDSFINDIEASFSCKLIDDYFIFNNPQGINFYCIDLRNPKTHGRVHHMLSAVNSAFELYHEAIESIDKAIEIEPEVEEYKKHRLQYMSKI